MEGWIKIHREILDHWIFQDGEKFKWWIYLLLSVNHEKKKVVFRNRLYVCDRGQTVKSLKTFSNELNVSRSKIRSFLKLLTNDTMINTENLTHTTRITICNYDYWQGLSHTDNTQNDQPKARHLAMKKTVSNTNKNVKECKEWYREQIKLSDNDKNYISFAKFLFENNDTGEPLMKVLTLKQQISWDFFQILEKKIEVMKEKKGYSGTLKQKVMGYINGDYKKKIFFGTMDTWITGDANKGKIEIPDNDEIRQYLKNGT